MQSRISWSVQKSGKLCEFTNHHITNHSPIKRSKLQRGITRVNCYTMIARAAVLIGLVPSAAAFLPSTVRRHSSALRAQASQLVQVEEKPGSFMRDEVPDDGLQKYVAVCEIVADIEKRMARRRALQQDHIVWERTVMLPSQTAQKQTEFKVADEDWDRPDEEKEDPRVLWDMSLLEEGAFFPDGMALCVAAASEADFLAFLAQDPYLREGDVFDQVTTYRWTQINERNLRRDPYDGVPHFIICSDKPNTADLRANTRDAHLKHLGDSEKVIMAGPLRGAGGSYVAQTAEDFVAAKREAQEALKAARIQAEEERLMKEASETPARKRTKAEISKAEEAAILLEESERDANIKLKAAKDEASRVAAAEFEAATLAACVASGPVVGSLLLASGHSVEEVQKWCQTDPYYTAGVFASVKVRRAHAVDVTGLYVLSEAEGGESGDVADIMESKRLQAEADLLGHYEEEDDDDEDNDEEGVYADGLSDDDDEDDDNSGLVDGSASSDYGRGSGDADDYPEVTPEEAALFEAMENEP